MRKLSADFIYPITSPAIKEGVIILDDKGKILEISDRVTHPDVKVLEGILCPGFVNAHCHIELSHLKGKVDEHTGLLDFVKPVMKKRDSSIEVINIAMQNAIDEMLRNGIVAVGDISNKMDSINIKKGSKLISKTFIELVGFNPEKAQQIFAQGKILQKEFTIADLKSVIVPHASYSVSDKLLQLISQYALATNEPISIHMQEIADEDLFFQSARGKLTKLYKDLGIDISFFKPKNCNTVQAVLNNFESTNKTILVHNTYTKANQIEWIAKNSPNNYWCLCPNANLYIENKMPPVDLFSTYPNNICLGTDSLASNHQLSILEEMKTIAKHFPKIKLDILLQWATLNGAKALGFDDQLGSFEVGKQPGVIQLLGSDIASLTVNKVQ